MWKRRLFFFILIKCKSEPLPVKNIHWPNLEQFLDFDKLGDPKQNLAQGPHKARNGPALLILRITFIHIIHTYNKTHFLNYITTNYIFPESFQSANICCQLFHKGNLLIACVFLYSSLQFNIRGNASVELLHNDSSLCGPFHSWGKHCDTMRTWVGLLYTALCLGKAASVDSKGRSARPGLTVAGRWNEREMLGSGVLSICFFRSTFWHCGLTDVPVGLQVWSGQIPQRPVTPRPCTQISFQDEQEFQISVEKIGINERSKHTDIGLNRLSKEGKALWIHYTALQHLQTTFLSVYSTPYSLFSSLYRMIEFLQQMNKDYFFLLTRNMAERIALFPVGLIMSQSIL